MAHQNENGDDEDAAPPFDCSPKASDPEASDPESIEEEPGDDYDAGAIKTTPRPDARPDGEPQHMFFGKEDESVLAKRLMLWGGHTGIVSFEGMLSKDLTPSQERSGSDQDIVFLQSLQLSKKMAYSHSNLPTYRFICFPNAPYNSRMPTGLDVIRDLFNDEHFSADRDGLDIVDIAFPGDADSVCRDQIHTDRKKQYVFSHRSELDKSCEDNCMPETDDVVRDLLKDEHFSDEQDVEESVIAVMYGDADADQIETPGTKEYVVSQRVKLMEERLRAEFKADHKLSIEAHEKLESFVKDGRLYYVMFHTKKVPYEDSPETPMAECAYLLAVGVSPNSGNLVGVFTMDAAPRSVMPLEDEGSISLVPRPEASADGEPQQIFYWTRDESAMSKKLMLWGGHSGIVSFEGMLSKEMTPSQERIGSDQDISFLQSLQMPEQMYSGAATVPVFRFMCFQDTAYTDRVPTGRDVVRDLCFEAHFRGEKNNFDLADIPFQEGEGDDQIHTDRDKQYLFVCDSELSEYAEDEREEMYAAHRSLERYVKDNRLYYAVFHTKRHFRNGPEMTDHLYAFAVGVSPHSGNLVGAFSMQVSHNLTE